MLNFMMMDREEIESRIWEYLDGNCNETEKAQTAQLIASNPDWVELYNELRALHAGIASNMELEQPSMRFTKSVMDEVGKVHTARAARKYINMAIIRGIAAFFIIAILLMLGYSFAIAYTHGTDNAYSLPLPIYLDNIFNDTTFSIFIMANIVIALMLFDTIIRKRKIIRSTNAH